MARRVFPLRLVPFRMLLLLGGTSLACGLAATLVQADATEAMFARDRLLEVDIQLPAASWDKLRFQHPDLSLAKGGKFPPRPYTYFPATVSVDGTRLPNVGVRKKGFIGSVTPTNPSLKVDFTEYQKALRFSGMDRLTLNNNLQDPSCLNQFLVYYLFRKAGLAAPRCNFAKVTVNGEYKGVYSHVESIKKPFLRRHFGSDGGNLYEGRRSDFRPGWLQSFDRKTNKKEPDKELQRIVDALALSDDAMLAALDEVVDLEAFFKFWALECLVGHWDGYAENLNNFYLYQDPTTDKFTFIPWGPDEAFGDDNPFMDYRPPASVRAVGMLCRKLYNYPPGRERYFQALRGLLDEVWDEEELQALVDEMEALIGPHLKESNQKPLHAMWIAKIKRFIASRRGRLEAEFEQPLEKWEFPLEARPGANFENPIGHVKATFKAPWRRAVNLFNPFQGSEVTLDIEVRGVKPDFLISGAAAQPFIQPMRYGDPNIVVGGVQKADGHMLVASFTLAPDHFQAGELAVDIYTVMGALVDVNPLNPGSAKVVGILLGEMTLESAGTKPGELVVGEIDVIVHRD